MKLFGTIGCMGFLVAGGHGYQSDVARDDVTSGATTPGLEARSPVQGDDILAAQHGLAPHYNALVAPSAASCVFRHGTEAPVDGPPPHALPSATWAFISALLSHRIQALHRSGESALETRDVGLELGCFRGEGGEGYGARWMRERMGGAAVDVFAPGGMDGLFLGLVYEGREVEGGVRAAGDVKECVQHAIRGVYETREFSGWMELGGTEKGNESETGEWVSYLIYREG